VVSINRDVKWAKLSFMKLSMNELKAGYKTTQIKHLTHINVQHPYTAMPFLTGIAVREYTKLHNMIQET